MFSGAARPCVCEGTTTVESCFQGQHGPVCGRVPPRWSHVFRGSTALCVGGYHHGGVMFSGGARPCVWEGTTTVESCFQGQHGPVCVRVPPWWSHVFSGSTALCVRVPPRWSHVFSGSTALCVGGYHHGGVMFSAGARPCVWAKNLNA